jgi:hypothetical protein
MTDMPCMYVVRLRAEPGADTSCQRCWTKRRQVTEHEKRKCERLVSLKVEELEWSPSMPKVKLSQALGVPGPVAAHLAITPDSLYGSGLLSGVKLLRR